MTNPFCSSKISYSSKLEATVVQEKKEKNHSVLKDASSTAEYNSFVRFSIFRKLFYLGQKNSFFDFQCFKTDILIHILINFDEFLFLAYISDQK